MAVLLLLPCLAAAGSAQKASGQLKIINYNVDGLPIPSAFSSTGKNTVETTAEISKPSPTLFWEKQKLIILSDYDGYTVRA